MSDPIAIDGRIVTVTRMDTHDAKSSVTGKIFQRRIEVFRYVWVEVWHPDEADWTEAEIEAKYSLLGSKVREEIVDIK